jgi:hypothetical protein
MLDRRDLRWNAAMGRKTQMLGPDAKQRLVFARQQFMGGVPMNRAAKAVAGRLYNSCGGPFCSILPSRMSTMRSAMVIASV